MSINMKEGEVWPLVDALHALLMVSANDAALRDRRERVGKHRAVRGRHADRREALGPRDSTFNDPAGLDAEGEGFRGGSLMSAYDLAVVARNALAVPAIADTAKLLEYDFTDPTGLPRTVTNHNDSWLNGYAGATGLKTGLHREGEPHARRDRDARRPHADRGRARDLRRRRLGGAPDRPVLRDAGRPRRAGLADLPPVRVATADARAGCDRRASPARSARPARHAVGGRPESTATRSGARPRRAASRPAERRPQPTPASAAPRRRERGATAASRGSSAAAAASAALLNLRERRHRARSLVRARCCSCDAGP